MPYKKVLEYTLYKSLFVHIHSNGIHIFCVLCVTTNVRLYMYMYMHASYCLTRDVIDEAGPHSIGGMTGMPGSMVV